MQLTSTPRTRVEPAQTVARLHDAIAHPEKVRGVRLPKFPSIVPTATTQTTLFGPLSTLPSTASSKDTTLLLTRDVMLPLWAELPGGLEEGAVVAPWSYQVGWQLPSAQPGTTSYLGNTSALSYSRSGNIGAGGDQITVTGGSNPPFSVWNISGTPNTTSNSGPIAQFPDMHKPNLPFIFVPAGATAVMFGRINATPNGGLDHAFLNIETAATPSEADVAGPFHSVGLTLVGNTAVGITTSSVNRWVRLVSFSATYPSLTSPGGAVSVGCGILVTNATSVTVTQTTAATNVAIGGVVTTNKLLVPLSWARPTNITAFSSRPFEALFPTGVRLTLENVTKIVNREGTITAASVENSGTLPWNVVDDPNTYLANVPAERKGRWAAEHGVSATVMPSLTATEVRSNLYFQTAGVVPTMCIRNGDWGTVIVVADADSSTVSGFSANLTYTWEYVATTQFVESMLTNTKLEDYRAAVVKIGSNPVAMPLEVGSVLTATGMPSKRQPRSKAKTAEAIAKPPAGKKAPPDQKKKKDKVSQQPLQKK